MLVWLQSLDARAILEERRKSRAGKSEPAIAPAVALDPAADPMVGVLAAHVLTHCTYIALVLP